MTSARTSEAPALEAWDCNVCTLCNPEAAVRALRWCGARRLVRAEPSLTTPGVGAASIVDGQAGGKRKAQVLREIIRPCVCLSVCLTPQDACSPSPPSPPTTAVAAAAIAIAAAIAMANPALGAVLEFLFSANLESTEAFATAKTFLEAGVNSKEAVLALTPERLKDLAPKKAHRKLLGALRRAAEQSASSPGSSSASAKRARKAADEPDPTPPPVPDAVDEGLVVLVNRSPVMVLWAACLAHLDGYTWAEALSLGSTVASQMARAKGSSLGLYSTAPPQRQHAPGELEVGLLGYLVPALRSEAKGVRGLAPKYNGAAELEVAHPAIVHRSLLKAYGAHYGAVYAAMAALAPALSPAQRRERNGRLGLELYRDFRPAVPEGAQGWGQPGRLELRTLASLRERHRAAAAALAAVTMMGEVPSAAAAAGPSGAAIQTGASMAAPGGGAAVKREVAAPLPLLPAAPATAETAAAAAKVEASPRPVKLELAAVTAGAGAGVAPSSHASSSTLPLPLSPDQQARIAASREAALARKKAAAIASGQAHA